MRARLALLALAALSAPVLAAASGPMMPASFRGSWVLVGGNCTNGLQMEGVLTIQPRRMMHGEIEKTVTGLRRVHAGKYGVDTRNRADGVENWTETALLTLSSQGQRLTFEQTRHNGRLLPQRRIELLKRCS